ncbi:alpha/beta hydrolase family protein [Membranihabitans maritimus]|uniref:alpha/beta hydrolase family protein n=1 Tax=Membranihabitans maritimus TaxID=2904244 RepID=UPI001F4232B7|nr:carboxylesterase family protein [Membranihabitans maritimus]
MNKYKDASAIIFLFILIINPIGAQEYCNSPFTENSFSGVITTEMSYDTTTSVGGNEVILDLDLYYSEEVNWDTRPLMVLLHGGAYLAENGDKLSEEIVQLAQLMASKGFVVASLNYRTWSIFQNGVPSKDQILDVALKSVYDLDAGIYFLVRNNGINGIPAFDEENIVVGGGSAGAITTIHRLYLDSTDLLDETLSGLIDDNGGFFEKDPDEFSIVAGVNLSGGILDTAWLSGEFTPLISMHGDNDETVPYNTGKAVDLIDIYGSFLIDQQLNSLGVTSYLYTFEGGGHSNIYTSPLYQEDLFAAIDTGLIIIQNEMCVTTSLYTYKIEPKVEIVNTLVEDILLIDNSESINYNYHIFDLKGQLMKGGQIIPGRNILELYRLPVGGKYIFNAYNPDTRGNISRMFFYAR